MTALVSCSNNVVMTHTGALNCGSILTPFCIFVAAVLMHATVAFCTKSLLHVVLKSNYTL